MAARRSPIPGSRPSDLLSASQLQARAPQQKARLQDYCAGAMFVQQLLSRGYGFDERTFRGVNFQKKVGGGRASGGRGPGSGPGFLEAEATPPPAGG